MGVYADIGGGGLGLVPVHPARSAGEAAHPDLWQGLTFAALAGRPDVVTGAPYVAAGSVTAPPVTPGGAGPTNTTTTSGSAYPTYTVGDPGTVAMLGDAEFAALTISTIVAGSGVAPGLISTRTGNTDGYWSIYLQSDVYNLALRVDSGGSFFAPFSGPAGPSAVRYQAAGARPQAVALHRAVGGTYTLIVDGEIAGTLTNSVVPPPASVGQDGIHFHRLIRTDGVNNTASGDWYGAAVWQGRTPGVAALRRLTADPFALWRPVAQSIPPGTGGLGQLWVQGASSIDALAGLSVQTASGIQPVAAIWRQGASSIDQVWEA